jgi:hypothetical protein
MTRVRPRKDLPRSAGKSDFNFSVQTWRCDPFARFQGAELIDNPCIWNYGGLVRLRAAFVSLSGANSKPAHPGPHSKLLQTPVREDYSLIIAPRRWFSPTPLFLFLAFRPSPTIHHTHYPSYQLSIVPNIHRTNYPSYQLSIVPTIHRTNYPSYQLFIISIRRSNHTS